MWVTGAVSASGAILSVYSEELFPDQRNVEKSVM